MEDLAVVQCPTCVAVEEHEVLKASTNTVTLRCLECGHVHSTTPAAVRPLEVHIVISDQEGRAFPDSIMVAADEEVAIGDEFEHQGRRLLVTGLEARDGTFPQKTKTQELKVLHAKRFDFVMLKLSLNQGENTRSFEKAVDPDERIAIGEVHELDDVAMVIKTIKSDQNRTLHKGFLLARNVVRAFCDVAPPGAREGQKVATRLRGAPPPSGKRPDKGSPSKPGGKPGMGRPGGKPGGAPGGKPGMGRPGGKPGGAPGGKPGGKPAGKPGFGPRPGGRSKPSGASKPGSGGSRSGSSGGPRRTPRR